ncbi:MAG: hypothetical protein FJW20_17355 [Acidimicrobiia bacterium]|nr:hypothetical protein [Acidimicrobiia bacterium]
MQSLSRRQFLASTAALGLARAQTRPNVLLIMADDLGYECLDCYGGTSYKTPHLDRLASQGIRFTHAYAQPLCTPTRVQLMTGQYNFRNWRAFAVMDPKTAHLRLPDGAHSRPLQSNAAQRGLEHAAFEERSGLVRRHGLLHG